MLVKEHKFGTEVFVLSRPIQNTVLCFFYDGTMGFVGCEIHVFENDNYLTLIALQIRIALCFRK